MCSPLVKKSQGVLPMGDTNMRENLPSSNTHMTHSTKLKLVEVRLIPHEPEAPLGSPQGVADHARAQIGETDREQVITYHLNSQYQPISYEKTSIGTLSDANIHPREVLKAAILSNAAAIIIVHNHPGGNCNPSIDDKNTCKGIKQACDLIGITLLDFVIVTTTEHYSFGQEGILDEAEAGVQSIGQDELGDPSHG